MERPLILNVPFLDHEFEDPTGPPSKGLGASLPATSVWFHHIVSVDDLCLDSPDEQVHGRPVPGWCRVRLTNGTAYRVPCPRPSFVSQAQALVLQAEAEAKANARPRIWVPGMIE